LLETDGTYAIIYTYDYDGRLISFNYDSDKNEGPDGVEYYYLRNQQGDITKIVDEDNNLLAIYDKHPSEPKMKAINIFKKD
jgi:hypothetical protein